MKTEEKEILWGLSFYDEKPYLMGFNAKAESKNPFKKNTNSWYNWNHGYNMNTMNILNKIVR